jgi:uncharacterized membrane protein YeaQ/YmgE (transglycosylase-associated protein family)
MAIIVKNNTSENIKNDINQFSNLALHKFLVIWIIVELIAGLSSRLYMYEHNEDFVWWLNLFTGVGIIFGICAGPYIADKFTQWKQTRHAWIASFISFAITILFLFLVSKISRQ